MNPFAWLGCPTPYLRSALEPGTFIALLFIATGVRAQTESAAVGDAVHSYELGKAAYEEGRYEAAVSAFQASYERSRQSILLFNIAQALRLAGRCDEALTYYERYRSAMAREASEADLPSDLEAIQNEAERCVRRKNAEVVESRPTTSSAESEPEPPAPKPASDVESSLHWTRWTGLACVTVAGGAAIAGTVFAIKAEQAENETSRLSENGGVWTEDARNVEQEGKRDSNVALVSFAAALVTGGVGAWLLLRPIDDGDTSARSAAPRTATPANVSFGISAGSASIALRGAF